MDTGYCPSCFQKLSEPGAKRLCPGCGFDLFATPQPQNALPWYTMLHDRYLVGRVLGQGGFGITYIGFDTSLQRKVAIKEYYPNGAVVRDAGQSCSLTWLPSLNAKGKESGCESFLREARKMARIDSIPGIVRVTDTFAENDTSYIVMDYLEGVTLRQYVRANGPMTFARCIELLHPLFGAIDELHTKGMIHRDISPDNIMIRDNGTVWLLDFGAAKDMAGRVGGESSAVVARSGFSPSEQYSGKNIGPWTDVYALCATIYYCVSGRTLPDASERVQDDSIRWEPVRVPEDIRETIREGLSMRYSDRIQSVSELVKRLDGTQADREDASVAGGGPEGRGTDNGTEVVTGPGGDGGHGVSIDPFTEETAKRRRKDFLKKAAAAAAAVLLLAGVAAFAVSQLGSGGTADGDPEESGSVGASDAAESESAEKTDTPENSEQVKSDVPEASEEPVQRPTIAPTERPTPTPTERPTPAPTERPAAAPTQRPTPTPTERPTAAPTQQPSAAPPTPATITGTCGDNLTWQINGAFEMTISGTGDIPDFASFDSSPWAYYRASVASVVITNGVTGIGDHAFDLFINAKSISIPNTVTRIGNEAFGSCWNLTSVSLPNGLRFIGSHAFYQCRLSSVTIPANVSSIGRYAFLGCDRLTDVTFRGSAPQIDNTAFATDTLTISYPANDPTWEEMRKKDFERADITWRAT